MGIRPSCSLAGVGKTAQLQPPRVTQSHTHCHQRWQRWQSPSCHLGSLASVALPGPQTQKPGETLTAHFLTQLRLAKAAFLGPVMVRIVDIFHLGPAAIRWLCCVLPLEAWPSQLCKVLASLPPNFCPLATLAVSPLQFTSVTSPLFRCCEETP